MYTTDVAQIVFLDTPGIHKSDSLLNRRMISEIRAALEERDLLLYLVDSTRRFTDEDTARPAMIRKSALRRFWR